jgi:hypothetical protein
MGVSSTVEDTPRKRKSSTAMMVTTAIVAGTLPALVGLVLLGSNALKCPLLTRTSRYWWNPVAREIGDNARLGKRLTTWWGLAFVVVGLLQGAAALFLGLSITSPADSLVRSAGAIGLEGLVVIATIALLRRWSGMKKSVVGQPKAALSDPDGSRGKGGTVRQMTRS